MQAIASFSISHVGVDVDVDVDWPGILIIFIKIIINWPSYFLEHTCNDLTLISY